MAEAERGANCDGDGQAAEDGQREGEEQQQAVAPGRAEAVGPAVGLAHHPSSDDQQAGERGHSEKAGERRGGDHHQQDGGGVDDPGDPVVLGAAASIFFAYVGFDAVSTAAEETKNPQRNLPIGLIGSLAICTIFYLLVAAGAIGTIGAQPVVDAAVHALAAGSSELTSRCVEIASAGSKPLVCSNEVLPDVLRLIGYGRVGDLVGLAAAMALPSVILMMLFGQTRTFFVMARDGLLPERFASIHPRWGMTVNSS